MDIRAYNRQAWSYQVHHKNQWTIPVDRDQIAAARLGQWSLLLTETKAVPREWFPAKLNGLKILCLASGGGQQGPILAAAGAEVTVFDNSPEQLAQDRLVAEREGLAVETVEGDMADLSVFDDETFELVFHPVSNLFVPQVEPVWQEAYRVLKPEGSLLAGFMNPIWYIFDIDVMDNEKRLEVRFRIPYSDVADLPSERLQRYIDENVPLEYGHSLDSLLGGQLRAGFVITGFYEDSTTWSILSQYIPSYIATRAVKLKT